MVNIKQKRFRKRDFQQKLERARKYARKSTPADGPFFSARRTAYLFLILAAIYFLALSPVFLASHESEPLKTALKTMGRGRFYLMPSNHILVLNKANLLSALQKESPEIRKITNLKKSFPNKIEVELEERQPRYVWHSGDNFYLLDQDGVVFSKILDYRPGEFSQILITDRTERAVVVGENLQVSKIVNFIEEAQMLWPQHISQTSLADFSLSGKKSLDIFARAEVGFSVYFDLNRGASVQLENLALLLNQEIRVETYSGLSYIDLRLPAFAYYCYKDAPCAQENATSTPPL